MMDIFQRTAKARGWDNNEEDIPPEVISQKQDDQRVWNDIMKQLHEPFEILSEAVDQGIEHAAIVLELMPRPKEQKKAAAQKDADVEASAGDLRPGMPGFAKVVDQKLQTFYSRKSEILHVWAKDKGLSSDGKFENWDEKQSKLFERRSSDQSQLYVLLYMEKLMQATGGAVQDLVAFAEQKIEDGTMKKNRLIFPRRRRMNKWFFSIFKADDSTAEESPDVVERGMNVVFVGDGYALKKDPEHLPATNVWQHIGNGVRKFSAFFGSEESVFGFRVGCATMTIGIVAFLESTQRFFIEQRLVWAMIIIAIGMTQSKLPSAIPMNLPLGSCSPEDYTSVFLSTIVILTSYCSASGQSIFGFFCRVGGTLVAMINTYIIWYIVDEKTPGVIVFLWLFIFAEYFFFVKYPQFVPAVMICIVTQVLIIGYELQVRTLGVAASEASGQPYYP